MTEARWYKGNIHTHTTESDGDADPEFVVNWFMEHHYYDFHPGMSNPGRGWVVVRAKELTVDAIVDGLATGEFYSSTGIVLTELERSDESVYLEIEEEKDFIFTTIFSGKDGIVLAEETGPCPSYSIKGDEGYVRATVRSSSGGKAWTQPVFVKQ